MILFYLAIIVLALWRCKIIRNQSNESFNGALSISRTNAVKGFFILVVFFRHIFPYIVNKIDHFNYFDRLFMTADSMIRQLLVVMFLFYSGYGVAESISQKGDDYIKAIPRKRVLITFLNFVVAVCAFIALIIILGRPLTIKQCLLALIGWETIGNSNWYIVCIILLYWFTYISYMLFTQARSRILSLGALSIIYIAVFQLYRGRYWVDTTMAYLTGVVFSTYKRKFEPIFKNYYWSSLIVVVIFFSVFYFMPYQQFNIAANIYAIFFSLAVVLITMKIKLENVPLIWLGKKLFPLYIYQRISMIALFAVADGSFVAKYPYFYVILCFIITLLIATGYNHIAITERHLNVMSINKASS